MEIYYLNIYLNKNFSNFEFNLGLICINPRSLYLSMEIIISKIERKLTSKPWKCLTMLTSQLAVAEEKVL